MGKSFAAIMPEHEAFIRKQRLFFVGTAPLQADGHVNLSPKGHDVFRILSPNKVAYLDLTGSGNETSAHLLENGRITFMFTAFEGPPMILRLYGTGRVVLPHTAEWAEQAPLFDMLPGARQIIVADIQESKTSCGFSVPYFSYEGERDILLKWAEKKGNDGLTAYWQEKNACSADGLPTPIGLELERTREA